MIAPPDTLLGLLLSPSLPYISGEACAKVLGISRAAVHKRVEKLRALGWLIEASPKRGFSLQKPYPFALIPELIAPSIGLPLFFAPVLGSTNGEAKKMSSQAPFVLMARSQTAGSGRAGRSWQQQADKDLAFSCVFKLDLPPARLFSIIRMAALSVHGALSSLGAEVEIKWPNDVITADGAKVCGILTESLSEDHGAHCLVVGIGINVNGLPAWGQSLKGLLGREVDINGLAADVINRLEALLGGFPANEGAVGQEWAKKLAWVGEQVRLTKGDTHYEGIFEGCDEFGGVILQNGGERQNFFAGDLSSLTFRKPQ